MVKSVQVTCPPDLRYTEKKRISKIAIWGPQSNHYFSLRALHFFHDNTCIAKTKTQTEQKVVGGGGSMKSGFSQPAL